MLVHVVADASELTGMTNLMSYYGLEHSYNKFGSKKVKEELSAFLPALPGNIDTSGNQDNRFVIVSYLLKSAEHFFKWKKCSADFGRQV